MGLVVFVMLLIILALLRPRLPPRKSGPLIEWGAFTEPAYMLFTLGVFLLYWTLYFAFFYVCRTFHPVPFPRAILSSVNPPSR